MVALALVVGPGRFGADVGGVITIAVAGATAVAWPARGPKVVAAPAVPVVALAALAVIDLASGADSHFSTTVLNDPANLPTIVERRYEHAFTSLTTGAMPLATAVALALAAYGIRRRTTIVPFPVWRSALAGGLAGSVAGALVNDSGPLLLVLGVAVLAAATVYVRTGATRTEAVQAGL